jgi:hypothetical protein
LGAGRQDTAQRQDGGENCLVLCDSIIRNAKTEHTRIQ